MTDRLQDGLDILRREARGATGKKRSWKMHCELMRRAKAHVEICGASWQAYQGALSREFAELLKL